MKTRSITEVFESVQKEKEQIMNEKQQLLMRASVGYEELTPRPSAPFMHCAPVADTGQI